MSRPSVMTNSITQRILWLILTGKFYLLSFFVVVEIDTIIGLLVLYIDEQYSVNIDEGEHQLVDSTGIAGIIENREISHRTIRFYIIGRMFIELKS